MKKKLLTVLLIAIIVFNFICVNVVHADLDDVARTTSRLGGNGTIKADAAKEYVESGTDPSGKSMTNDSVGISFGGVVLQGIAGIIDIVLTGIQDIMTIFTANPNSAGNVGFTNAVVGVLGPTAQHYTIERTVFNEIAIFNINAFNFSESFTNGIGSHTETIYQHKLLLDAKKSVAGWFYTCRTLAMMINLCILIYVGIKMAISTIASEEARYKKMLIYWAESMIVLFLLHYIMYAMFYVGEAVLNIIQELRYNAIASGGAVSFEDMVISKIYLAFATANGGKFFLYSLFFWFLTGIQLKFFITYVKRTFTVLFLVVISPFITVTYPIDKMGDGKAQAFEAWFKELLINIAIQPIHAGVYLVFVYTAGKIAQNAPWVAMVLLLSLGRIENIVRNIFKITDSVQNIDDARKPKGGKGGGIGGILHMFKKG